MPSEELRNLMFVVTGERFPETDEDVAALRGLVMQSTQGKVDILKGKVDESIAFVGDALPGDIGRNFIAAMESVRPELDKLTEGMGKASGGLRKTAMDVREAKWNLIAELIRLAAEIAIFTALAAVTGGASATQIAVRKMIARVRMLVILYELSNRIPIFSAVTEAIEEALLTLATRLALMRWAPEGQRPGGVDWRDVGIAAVFGALTGAFSELFGVVVRKVTNAFNSYADNWMKDPPTKKWNNDDLGDGLFNTPGGNRWGDLPDGPPRVGPGPGIRRHVIDEIGQAPSEGAAETLAEGLVNEMFYDGFEVNPWTAVGAMVSRQVEMGLMGGGLAFGGALHNFFSFKDGLGGGLRGGSIGGPGGATGGPSGGSTGGSTGETGNGELGNVDTGPGGGFRTGFQTRTGDLDGLGGVGDLDGGHGLRGGNGNGPNGAGGPDPIAGPGSVNGGRDVRGLGSSAGLSTPDGLDGLRRHNGHSPLTRFDDSHQTPGPGPQRLPGLSLTSGSEQVPGPQQAPGSPLASGSQQLPGSPQTPGAHRSTGLDAVSNLDQRVPGQDGGTLGGQVPTSSGASPDREHEGHRQAPSGGAQHDQGQDQARHRHAEEALEVGADQKQEAPRPQPETRFESGQQPHTQAPSNTPASPQPQPETRIATSSHSQSHPETQQQPGSRAPSQSQPGTHTSDSPRPEQQPQTPSSHQPQTQTPSSPQPQTHTPVSPQPQTHAPSSPPQSEPSGEAPPPADEAAPDPVTAASPGPLGADGHTDPQRPSAAEALREQHREVVRRLSGALDSVQELRDRMDTGVGTSGDAARLDRALDDVARAEKELTSAEDQLRDLGTDPHSLPPDRDHGPAPAVERDGGQRRWIAGQVRPEDLAADVRNLDFGRAVDREALDTAGISAPPALRAQWQLGSTDVPLAESGLPPVDQARLLMVEPGPWPQALEVTAANAARRLWQESYADFAADAPPLADGKTGYTPSQAWSTATGLVLPLEMHPVRADSRHAVAPYRDAVREVADLLMAGGGRDAADSLADRLRADLGLPSHADDAVPPTAAPAGLPAPIPTASVSPRTAVPPAAVPPPSALTSAAPKTGPKAGGTQSGEPEPGPAKQEPQPDPETVVLEPAPVVVPAVPLVATSSEDAVPRGSETASPAARQPAVLLAPPTEPDVVVASPVRAAADPKPPAPRRTNTMLSSASSSSEDSDDVLTAEQAQDVKFLRDKSELYHRIAGIRALAADPAFRKGISDFLDNIDRDRKSSTPTPVDHAAIEAIMTGLQKKGVYGNRIQYSWYHRHQDKEGFEGALEAHAKRSANHGALWSKLGSATATAEAGVGRGVVLEASIQGRMFDGLLFGLSSWSSSPALGVLWERLSKSYVESLTGWATAHVLDGTTNTSVLNRIEWPTLARQIEAGKVDGLNIVVYRTVPNPDTGALDLVPVDTFPVRTQEEFDQVPQAPADADWYQKQSRVDQEQRAALVKVYSRENQIDQLDDYVSDLLGKHGNLTFRPTLTPHTTFRGSFSSRALADVAVRLPVVHPDQRALLIDALSSDERRTLAANEEVVNSLQAHLSPEDFTATTERLRADGPEGPPQQEAEDVVSVPPWSSAALAAELSGVDAGERTLHLRGLSLEQRHQLLADEEFINGLREHLSPEAFVAAEAELTAEGPVALVRRPAPVVVPAVPLVATSSEDAVPRGSETASPPPQQPDALLAPPTEPHSMLAPPVPADADPIRDWRLISAGPNRLRSDALSAVDEAVAGLPADPSAEDVRPVLDAVGEWKKGKTPQSGRWDAITRLESAVIDRIDRIRQLNAPERPAPGAPVTSVSVAARQHPVEVDGYAPASGFEVELHRYRLELPNGHTYDEYDELVSVPGLLKITLDRAGGVPVLELVTEPARGLANGRPDGRAERSDVVRAFRDVVSRLENARPGSSISSVFPAEAGYRVDALAEGLPVKINEAGGDRMLVHHSASTPIAKAVPFLEHVGSRMRREPGPARTAHSDLGLGLQFAKHGRTRFDSWLDQHPEHRSGLLAWDHAELEGALALGYAQAAGAVRGSLDRSRPPKDLTAVVSRGSLAGIRRGLSPVPRAFLEDQAKQLAAEFATSFDVADLPKDVGVLDRLLPPRADQGKRATVGQYLDNLLRENPERPVDQREALLLRRTWPDLDGNPEAGAARLEPPVAVVQVRLYAATDSTAGTVENDFDTLADLSFGLYRAARTGRGLPKVGRPLAPAGSRPPTPPRRTNTMLSSASSLSSSQSSMDALTAEQAQDIKFLRDKSELYHRIAGIRALAADPAFRKGISDFLDNIDRDRKSSTPTPVDHAAIEAIMTGLQKKGVYGNRIQYSWYHRHQDKEGFEEALEAHATQSADHGGLWSKMGSAIPTENASVGHGVVLEASIQGRMFDGLLFGLSTWSSSPALGALWEQLSRTYVESLTGWATAHVLDGTTNTSVLNRIEWPTLRRQIEAGKVDGLNIVVYRSVSHPDTGALDLVPVDTFPVRTQEEFDQVPQAPADADWYRKQTRVDQEQRAALVKVYSRENQIDQLDDYVSDLLGKHGNLTFRPTLTPHATFRGSFSSSVLADLAVRLPTVDPGQRAALLRALSPAERRMLATNEELANSLREHLSPEDFAAAAAGLMVDGPESGGPASAARQEAEDIVSGMLADPEVTVSLLTGGRRVVVVPRGVAVTSLPQFAGLRGVEADGRPVDVQRALYHDGLIAIGEENLLGEPADVPGAGIQADGYGALRHELAHAIEEVLDPADRKQIEEHYRVKSAEGEAARWPDGPGANYSASNPRDYFAQLTNTYLAVNAGTDLATGSPRNNGADWVREHDPKLLPLLERLYGPGRPGILGSQDNPYVLSGFRALFDRAERDLAGELRTSESGSEPPSPVPAPDPSLSASDPSPGPRGRTGAGPDGRTLLAPPAQGGRLSRRLVEAMKQMFGRDIRRHPQFDALYDALALLNRLHESDPGRPRGPMDVGATAERVLHLDPGVDITPEDYRNLLLTTASAARHGWARSVASIAGYATHRTTGVLGPETWSSDPYQRYTARDWSGGGALQLDVDQVWAPGSRRGEPMVGSPALWGHRPHVALAERDADADLIIVRDQSGNARYVDDGEFAHLVALDPNRPPGAPVLLLVRPPRNAAPETMPRLLADLAGTRVWSTDGDFSLMPAEGPGNVRLIALVDRRPGRHVGVWFPSDPGLHDRSPGYEIQTTVGTALDSSDVESYPLTTLDGQLLTGRAYLTSDDLVRMEAALREASGVEYYANYDEGVPGAIPSRHGPMLRLPRALTDSYVLYLHARAGWASVSSRSSGRQYNLRPGELGRIVRRRPSLQQLDPNLPIFALGCELAQLRPGSDLLVEPSEAQNVSTQTQRVLFATDAQVTPVPTVGDSPPILVLSDDPDRPRHGIWEYRPEPDADTLRWIADVAGLPPEVAERSTRALRWVRALREVFDIDIDSDPGRQHEFTALIRDFGQLEMQRIALGVGPEGTRPLTWRELTRITDDFARRAGFSGGVVTHTLLRDVLLAARHRTLRLPGLPNMPNILFAPPTRADSEPPSTPPAAVGPPAVRIDTAPAETDHEPTPTPPVALAPDTEDSSDGSDADVGNPRSVSPSDPGPAPPDAEAARREPRRFPTSAPGRPRSKSAAQSPVPAPERPDRLDTAAGSGMLPGAPPADGPRPTSSGTASAPVSPPVRAAVPVRTAARHDIDFIDGGAQLGEDAQRLVTTMAQRLVGAAVRDLTAGLRIPSLKITGYGDGARIAVGSGPAQRPEGAGRLPARIVEDALRVQIDAHLSTLPAEMREAVRRVRGRALTADDFPIDARSGADPAPHPRPGERRAVVEVQVSTLSRAVDQLMRLMPGLNLYSDADPVLTLDKAPDLVLLRPLGAPEPPPPAPATDAARFDTDAVPDHLRPLYALVTDAMATDDATSVASLTALHLDRQGVFAEGTRLLAVDGSVRGRNWTGHPGPLADTAVRQRVPGSDTTDPSPTPWAAGTVTQDPFVVGTADGSHWGAELALPDGTRYRVSDQELSELVGRDPDLSSADGTRPVVLASSRAGAMGLDLPRMSAFRSGRPVYAHTGRAELVPGGQTSRLHIELSDRRDAKLPLGSWVLSLPDDWDASEPPAMGGDVVRGLDNRIIRMSDIENVTIMVGGRPAGRMLMNLQDQFSRESTGLDLAGFTEWVDVDPVTDRALDGAHPVEWQGRKPYVLWAHGMPGVATVGATDGRPVGLSGPETVRYLKRRPSFRRLDRKQPLVAVMCWASAKPGGALGGFADDAPFVPDPWATVSWTQQVANGLGQDVYGPSRVHVTGGPVGKPESGVYTNAQGATGTYGVNRPEPTPEELDRLSTVAGLDGLTAGLQDRRETTLRLVRGLRDLFGVEVENDRDDPAGDYRALLSGLGAVEAMRRADARLASRGRLTPHLVERIVRAHSGTEPAPHTRPVPTDPADVRTTLLAARTALESGASAQLSSFVALPGVDRALELLTEDDEDESVRQVLRLAPDRPVTADLRQHALWATVAAVEAVDGHPDTESLVRQVLHLRPYESVDVAEDGEALLWMAATAAAIGRDVYRPVALAAYHLQRGGVFAPDSALVSTAGLPVGRNWSSFSLSDRFNADLYTVTDPATGARTSHLPPWYGPERPFVVAVEPGSEAGTVSMPWLNGPNRSVPYDEFAEVLRMEPALRQMAPVAARVVVVGLEDRATQDLADVLGTRRALGRRVLIPRHPMNLGFDAQRHAHYLNITTSDPDVHRHWWDQHPEQLPPRSQAPAQTEATADTETETDTETDTDTAPAEPDRTAEGVPHDWVESRLEEPGTERYVPQLAGADWAGGRPTVSVADLLAVGVVLDHDQHAYAALMGGLPTASADLSLVQRYRLLRAWSGDDAQAVTGIAADLTAALKADAREYPVRAPAGRGERPDGARGTASGRSPVARPPAQEPAEPSPSADIPSSQSPARNAPVREVGTGQSAFKSGRHDRVDDDSYLAYGSSSGGAEPSPRRRRRDRNDSSDSDLAYGSDHGTPPSPGTPFRGSVGGVTFESRSNGTAMWEVHDFVAAAAPFFGQEIAAAGPITVRFGRTRGGTPGEWRPDSRSIILDRGRASAGHLAGTAVFEILNAASARRLAALEDEARSGRLGVLAEQTGWPAAQYFAMEVERIEWENGMRHQEIVAGAGGGGSGADLFAAEGDFNAFYERQVRSGHTHSYEFRYNLLREEAASEARRRREAEEGASSGGGHRHGSEHSSDRRHRRRAR
ncbi:lonely Cys domain-containing protein [Streptomyces sp. MH60]|uniref:lonely Cys domain-containing protein n=1 Tax=Streptomyces sp. MH60 TaxID=1940758 RepID=UPI0010573C55|nr:lonely Cys domain-containing protein [Streptomyces sp. MH60]